MDDGVGHGRGGGQRMRYVLARSTEEGRGRCGMGAWGGGTACDDVLRVLEREAMTLLKGQVLPQELLIVGHLKVIHHGDDNYSSWE